MIILSFHLFPLRLQILSHFILSYSLNSVNFYLKSAIVTKISKEDLQARLENLFQTVTIKDPNKKKGFTIIALFEKAEAYQDDNGLWQVDLACTCSALEYVFNIENLGYLRYRLKNIIDLTSRSLCAYIFSLLVGKSRGERSGTLTYGACVISIVCYTLSLEFLPSLWYNGGKVFHQQRSC